MTENDAIKPLKLFVSAVCEKPLAERIVALLGSARGHEKFLGMLSHRFVVSQGTVTPFTYTSPAPDCTCYIFVDHGPFAFGEPSPSFADALNRVDPMGAWLLVSASGRIGIFQPEAYIDRRVLIRSESFASS
jgi:hypothetical protein